MKELKKQLTKLRIINILQNSGTNFNDGIKILEEMIKEMKLINKKIDKKIGEKK